MVKLSETYTEPYALDHALNIQHLYFARRFDKEYTERGGYEYRDWEELMLMGKNSHGIWVAEGTNSRHISLDEAYKIYTDFVAKCKPANGYDIIDMDNDQDWLEDNEDQG